MTGYAAKLGPDQVYRLRRWLCRNDLFYLLVIVCKRQDINHDWLFARCREVELTPNGHLDLWAREHYKSTIITFGLSIQDVLASHGEDPEPRYNGREVTIGILSFNRPVGESLPQADQAGARDERGSARALPRYPLLRIHCRDPARRAEVEPKTRD